jgi:hypothetical protein
MSAVGHAWESRHTFLIHVHDIDVHATREFRCLGPAAVALVEQPSAGAVSPVRGDSFLGIADARGAADCADISARDTNKRGGGIVTVLVTVWAVDWEAVEGPAEDWRVDLGRGGTLRATLAMQARGEAMVMV